MANWRDVPRELRLENTYGMCDVNIKLQSHNQYCKIARLKRQTILGEERRNYQKKLEKVVEVFHTKEVASFKNSKANCR
jgi:hypothetical protein